MANLRKTGAAFQPFHVSQFKVNTTDFPPLKLQELIGKNTERVEYQKILTQVFFNPGALRWNFTSFRYFPTS